VPRELKTDLLVALTDGIGAALGSKVRRSFYTLSDRLLHNRTFAEWSERQRRFALDVLALAIVYQEIILPLSGSHLLIDRLRSHDISSIRLARSTFSSRDSDAARRCTEGFSILMERAHVPQELIFFATLDDFAKNLDLYFESNIA
jgi:hypothetical protein